MSPPSRRLESLTAAVALDPDDLAETEARRTQRAPAPPIDDVPTRRAAPSSAAAPAPSDPADWDDCLDDPTVLPGRKSFRSFYVEDTVFARFRAAVHWSSRREDAELDVPENMSVAVADFMAEKARELEDLYNGGRPFRATPEQRKAARRRTSKSGDRPRQR